jgi:hypothetical protein
MTDLKKIGYCVFGDPIDSKATMENIKTHVQQLHNVDFFIQSTELTNAYFTIPNVKTIQTTDFHSETEYWLELFKSNPKLSHWPVSRGFIRALLCIEDVILLLDATETDYDLMVFANWNIRYHSPVCFETFFPISGLHFSKQMINYAPTLSWFMTTEIHLPFLRGLLPALYTWMTQQNEVDWNVGVVLSKFFSDRDVVCHHRPCDIYLLNKPLPFLKKPLIA